ncbi:uncharacterized protein BX663DRAFT_501050 [Cokeromyces recurvatus]|uniref:uncharacterized protein n=1 Tax=Cokeromyces recurvatus TaxID=90255 RepID=UPI00221E41CB|nr:uncharacterized protein BX663DRAFT_501050 [Cokeromyces recurvatus]KAI7904924.1 hypothetical protein BX663DRAFT_501050 [Cokeromyces recurvatus]
MGTNNKLTTNGERTTAMICFFTGVAAVLMGYSIYSHLKTIHDRNVAPKKSSNKAGLRLEDSIRLKSLAYLTQSNNVNIQSSSVKIILERAMSPTYLPKIITACSKDQPIEIRSKALPALQLLTRKENNKAVLIAEGALEVLVDALKCTDPNMKEVTKRYAAVAVCDLIQGSDINKYRILELGILESIKQILTSEEIRNNELKYWTLMILYQISLSDPLPKVLTENEFVSLIARMARMTYGNTNMPKFCMQSLVRIAANVDVNEAKKVLTKLLEYNIVDLISNCLRGDDVELIYWAAGLMHEFVLKDIAADKFREIKGIHTIMAGLLSAEEMYISRVILRTIKFMAYGQDKFRREMVRSGMVKKIMRCLSLDDEDVRYWSILCIHVVAGQVESHEDIITAPEFEILLELALSTKIKVAIFVSDILSLICCISSNNTFMEPHITPIVKTLNALLLEDELDVQYNAAGAIFNVMTMTFAFASKVRDACFENLILVSKRASHERVQLICAKGALMVTIKSRFLIPKLNQRVTEPLMETINTIVRSILPVLMSQTLVRITKKNTSPSASSSSIHDDTIDDSDYDDKNLEKEKLSLENDYEDEDEGAETFLCSPEYIDITDQGTISNASRLEHVLKNREKASQKTANKDDDDSFNIDSTKLDISHMFDTAVPYNEREELLMKYELSTATRNQFVGSLTTLNILLENEKIVTNLMTEEESFLNFPSLDVGDNILTDIDDVAATIYNEDSAMNNDCKDTMKESSNTTTASFRSLIKESPEFILPKHIYQLTTNLVYLCATPALDVWAEIYYEKYPLEIINESRINGMYNDLIDWICSCAKLFDHDKKKSSSNKNQSHTSDSSINLDESSSIGIYSQQKNKQQQKEDRDDSLGNHDENQSVNLHVRKAELGTGQLGGEIRRKGLLNRALILLNSLMHYAFIRKFLIENASIIPILIYLYEECSDLTDHVMMCLGSLFANDSDLKIPDTTLQLLVALVWRYIYKSDKKNSNLFYSRLILNYCSRYISIKRKHDHYSVKSNNPAFVEIDLASRSKYCFVNYENRLQVRNDTWTFESVRATYGVPALDKSEEGKDHKYAFEVKLESSGLMQIGWATEHFQCDPEGGKGVGDDTHSYGYDGNRSKKWHGRYTSLRTSYGLKWTEGDIITCAIDMDAGEIRYYKNGKDMGVAFYGVLVSRSWYPAVSLATGQQCKFQFGGSIDPLKYLPDGYIPIASLVPNSVINIEEIPLPSLIKSYEEKGIITEGVDSASNDKIDDEGPIDDISNTSTSLGLLDENILHVEMSNNIYSRPSPSLYFEVKIGYLPNDQNSESSFHYLESSIMFGLQSLAPNTSIYFEYISNKMICYLELDSVKYQSKPFELCIQDGDNLGMFYIEKTNEIGLTVNGNVRVFIALNKKLETRAYIPFIYGPIRSEIVYGEAAFMWDLANKNLFKESISNYFLNLLGNREKKVCYF